MSQYVCRRRIEEAQAGVEEIQALLHPRRAREIRHARHERVARRGDGCGVGFLIKDYGANKLLSRLTLYEETIILCAVGRSRQRFCSASARVGSRFQERRIP